LISRKAAFDEPFRKNNLRASLDLPNTSQIYTSFRNKNGPKFPCNNIVEEHESKKCERSVVGGSTPLKFHHFKGIPQKYRSLRMVVNCFEYEKY
jgi:hypothetical protein